MNRQIIACPRAAVTTERVHRTHVPRGEGERAQGRVRGEEGGARSEERLGVVLFARGVPYVPDPERREQRWVAATEGKPRPVHTRMKHVLILSIFHKNLHAHASTRARSVVVYAIPHPHAHRLVARHAIHPTPLAPTDRESPVACRARLPSAAADRHLRSKGTAGSRQHSLSKSYAAASVQPRGRRLCAWYELWSERHGRKKVG